MCLYPVFVNGKYVACGRCLECKSLKSKEWSFRCALENKSCNGNSCLITLTYNDDNLPSGSNLVKSDLQKFVKRLRRRIEPLSVKYFACGEYGKKFARPHYHIIIFGWQPTDLKLFCRDKKGTLLFRSAFIESLWTFGFSSVGQVNLNSAKYVAKYMQKVDKMSNKVPAFIIMSKGLGYSAFKKEWLLTDKIYLDGKTMRLPRYFIDRIQKEHPFYSIYVDDLKESRNNNYNKLFSIDNNLLFSRKTFDENVYNDYIKERRNNFYKKLQVDNIESFNPFNDKKIDFEKKVKDFEEDEKKTLDK